MYFFLRFQGHIGSLVIMNPSLNMLTYLEKTRVANDHLFGLVDGHLKTKNTKTQGFVFIDMRNVQPNHLMAPAKWISYETIQNLDERLGGLRKEAGRYNPRTQCLVVLFDPNHGVTGGLVSRMACCNPECANPDGTEKLVTCEKSGTIYCSTGCYRKGSKKCPGRVLWTAE